MPCCPFLIPPLLLKYMILLIDFLKNPLTLFPTFILSLIKTLFSSATFIKHFLLHQLSIYNKNSKETKKHPREVFYKKEVLKHFAKFTRKHLCRSLFFIKVTGVSLLKKRLRHRCFPATFLKFLRISFSQDTSGRLLLKIFFCDAT